MTKVTLGGDRLGSGNKNKVFMKESQRSNFNLNKIWRSTMSAGTLVPFMSTVALPNSEHTIKLEADVKTHPTIAPLFGSYKVQLDVFQVPMRLYNASLHMNRLNIGLDMSQIKLPQIRLRGDQPQGIDIDNYQINPSSIFKYLGISGLGTRNVDNDETDNYLQRDFNAVPFLGYWDIFKNYYANKSETNAYVIHNDLQITPYTATGGQVRRNGVHQPSLNFDTTDNTSADWAFSNPSDTIKVTLTSLTDYTDQPLETAQVLITYITLAGGTQEGWFSLTDLFGNVYKEFSAIQCEDLRNDITNIAFRAYRINTSNEFIGRGAPKLVPFDLKNIDSMREFILTRPMANDTIISDTIAGVGTLPPYTLPFKYLPNSTVENRINDYSCQNNQEGLAVKTYQSDLFNNWVNTDWIEGVGGIAEVSKVITSGDQFYIDDLILSTKIHKMLMRIGISGGSYKDWQLAVYDQEVWQQAESPVYKGGLIKELAFSEVVSNAESQNQPLGTLAGRGVMTNKNKGGYVKIKANEPCYIMGIASITPRVDYHQGNKWDTNLKTLDDLHKPQLDGIGFQDLITSQMAWFEDKIDSADQSLTHFSAGKIPAWMNYKTEVNEIRGNFADRNNQMFMVLSRRYDVEENNDGFYSIKDLTTYIDPSKFNHIFADTSLDAQNFWVQIKVDHMARNKMSASVIPNL